VRPTIQQHEARRTTHDSRDAISDLLSRAQFELLLGSSNDPADADADRLAPEALERAGMAGRIQASSVAHEPCGCRKCGRGRLTGAFAGESVRTVALSDRAWSARRPDPPTAHVAAT
jgi:hypothetical protein